MNILKLCFYALLITITLLIMWILSVAVVYATKKAINQKKGE